MFPFVHIRGTMRAHDLRHEKPFLWLNIMALATKTVSEQFAIEETIWQIISRRIVAQHFVNMDLLLGVVCFASWSHYYKKDKPFMTTLSQLAVSLACELGLQGNVSLRAYPLERSTKSAYWNAPGPCPGRQAGSIAATGCTTVPAAAHLGRA